MARRVWHDGIFGNTPLSAERLNQMEDDIEQALSQTGQGQEQAPADFDGGGPTTTYVPVQTIDGGTV
jgi:hypothetical protein